MKDMSVLISSEIKTLTEIYANEKYPASFSSIYNFYKAANAQNSNNSIQNEEIFRRRE